MRWMRKTSSVARVCGFTLCTSVLGCGSLLRAQTPVTSTPQPTQLPGGTATLRVQTREVVLDVVVTDRKGHAVTNVPRSAFHVAETGVAQRIVSFSKPEDHLPAPDAPPIHSSAELIKAHSNVPINVIVLDELNTAFEDTAFGRFAVQKYLATQPANLKQATTVLSIGDSGLKVIIDFTQDRDRIEQAIKKHFPEYPFRAARGASSDAGDRLARCLGTLLQISQSVKGYPGRKSVIWVGKGFPSMDTLTVDPKAGDDVIDETQRVTTALLESRTVLNLLDPTATSVSSVDYTAADYVTPGDLLTAVGANGQALSGDVNFADFAPATGGVAILGHNDLDKQIGLAIDDGADYYTLVYSPTDKTDDPKKYRALKVTVDDPNLIVATRTGYYSTHQTQPGEIPKVDGRQLAFDLMNAGLSTITYSGLIVSAEKPVDGKIAVTVSPVGLASRTTSGGQRREEVTVMEVAFDGKNHAIEHHAEEKQAATPNDAASMTFEIDAPEPRGTARIRLIVRDALSGRLGTVDLAP